MGQEFNKRKKLLTDRSQQQVKYYDDYFDNN